LTTPFARTAVLAITAVKLASTFRFIYLCQGPLDDLDPQWLQYRLFA